MTLTYNGEKTKTSNQFLPWFRKPAILIDRVPSMRFNVPQAVLEILTDVSRQIRKPLF